MKRSSEIPRVRGGALALIAALLPAVVHAQAVEVRDGTGTVVVEGDVVRIEGPAGVTRVSGDWRRGGTVAVETDTERVLVELGAVTVEDRIQLNLAGDILFDFDSSAVRADAEPQLARVAHVIRARAVGDVYVIGHTDSKGDESYNQRLSQDRAVSVMGWLNRREGIPLAVMLGSGMGSRRPVADNTQPDGSDSPAGRARNRRVEIQMATREGVTVGPGVVIGPGGVTVDESGVRVGGGAVQVDASGVRVGNVSVGAGGVVVAQGGGTTISESPTGSTPRSGRTRVLDDESPGACPPNEACDFRCPYGDCILECQAGSSCSSTCAGGDCLMSCHEGATCGFSCSGGDCSMTCEPGATCDFSCSGGDCLFKCLAGANCRSVTCSGEDCRCTGGGC